MILNPDCRMCAPLCGIILCEPHKGMLADVGLEPVIPNIYAEIALEQVNRAYSVDMGVPKPTSKKRLLEHFKEILFR